MVIVDDLLAEPSTQPAVCPETPASVAAAEPEEPAATVEPADIQLAEEASHGSDVPADVPCAMQATVDDAAIDEADPGASEAELEVQQPNPEIEDVPPAPSLGADISCGEEGAPPSESKDVADDPQPTSSAAAEAEEEADEYDEYEEDFADEGAAAQEQRQQPDAEEEFEDSFEQEEEDTFEEDGEVSGE